MIININVKDTNADKVSYLLHKSPNKLHEFSLGFGKAYFLYSKYEKEEVSFSILVDIEPLDLSRGKNDQSQGIFDYVNDRPYATSSFMCTTISQILSSAISGRSKQYEELIGEKMEYEIEIVSLKVGTHHTMLERAFEPLGYEIQIFSKILDEKTFGEYSSNYVDLILKGKVTLQEMLQHLYVLIPVFDNNKHYYVSDNEVEKLLDKGGDWFENHPEREFIVKRYLNNRFINDEKLKLLSSENDIKTTEEVKVNSLNSLRLLHVVNKIKELEITSLVDLGCGEGKLIKELLNDSAVNRILGADISISELKKAVKKIKYDMVQDRVELVQSSGIYYDERFTNYDAICLIEVIEHIDELKLKLLKENIFGEVKPKYVLVTTPNAEYNKVYELDGFRHKDHRFEWTRSEFKVWCEDICDKYGYDVEFSYIGEETEDVGSPTQMGVFKLCV